MNRYGLADGFLRGAELGFGLARMKKQDALQEQRYQDAMEYRNARDTIADERYQQGIDYQRGRDTIADERYQQGIDYQRGRDEMLDKRYDDSFAMQKDLHDRQARNYDQAYEAGNYQFQRRKDEDQRADQLREVQGWISLLENGDDSGAVAESMNQNPQYQAWLQKRGLGDARFAGLRMNDTGKGEPGVITILEGKDQQTGKVRKGVATVNASSDPDDPVEVMPMPVLAGMVRDKANQLEGDGDQESAEMLRGALLKRLEAYQVSLGGAGRKPKWGDIEYRPGIGYGQRDTEGQFHQLDPEKGPAAGRYGLGRRGSGSGGARNSAFTNQIYKQAADSFQDDELNQVDNSLIRDLTVSLAQDMDLQSGGALAPGVYIQVAKEASQGLYLSQQAAEQRAIEELNQGKMFGSFSADDEEVQQRTQAILERDKAQFADRYVNAVGEMMDYRAGVPPLQNRSTGGAEGERQGAGQMSLDDAVNEMMQRAQSKGAELSPEQARQYLIQKYPDRFGSSETAAAPAPEAAPEVEKDGPRYGMSLGEQADQFSKDVVQPVGRGLKRLAGGMNDSAKAGKIKAELRAAAKSGMVPPAKTLASWIPMLSPEDQSLALELMADRYPDAPETRKFLQEYNDVATQ